MSRVLWPREHGAWAMLLLPFFSAVAVSGSLRWETLAALAAGLGVFLMQEPVLVLLRQRFVWKERREATRDAVFSALVVGVATAAAGGFLLLRLPWRPLIVLMGVAVILVALRAALTLRNLQRSAPLQVAEAIGISATALLGYLSCRGGLDENAFLLWGLFALHQTAALFVVRARIEAIVSAKSASGPQRRFRGAAWAGQSVLLAALVAAVMGKALVLAAALAVPFLLHTLDLLRLDSPLSLKTPLVRVGWREVAISCSFAALVVAAFLA